MADVDTYVDSQSNNSTHSGSVTTTTTTYTRRYIRTTVNLYPGIYQPTYNGGGTDVGGYSDANGYVAKFDMSGNAKWITLVGGPNYTRIYGIRVDSQGNVYATGRCGRSLDTQNAIQSSFAGVNNGDYGDQNAFLAKFNSNGVLLWMTYLGTSTLCRNLNLSPDETYLAMNLGYSGSGDYAGNASACSAWGPDALANAYLDTPTAHLNVGAMKVRTSDGKPIYATYLGGNADCTFAGQAEIDSSGNVYLLTYTSSTDLPVTTGCLSKMTGVDLYVCKFDSTLSNMLWGTYLGGNGSEGLNTNIIDLDPSGNVIIAGWTNSTNWPGTSGGYMDTYPAGSANAGVVTKLNGSNGNVIQSTYFGGTGSDSTDGISIDSSGNIWLAVWTTSSDMPYTADAYRDTFGSGTYDGAFICISNDLTSLLFSSFFGDSGNDNNIRAVSVVPDASKILVVGSTVGSNLPLLNAYQDTYQGYPGGDPGYGEYSGDAVVALFDLTDNPVSLIFSTYLGGTHWDMARAAVIKGNYCYVGGGTHSDDFPTYDY